MSVLTEKPVAERREQDNNDHDNDDEEKAFLPNEQAEHEAYPEKPLPTGLSRKFWFFAAVNTLSTVAIVFTNKQLFSHERLKHSQVTIAAFHFAVTALSLYAVSRPRIDFFQAKRVPLLKILPLAISMICNVVLLNLSLAYSSIQFYQIVRVLVTPAVALMNYIIVRATIPVRAALTLIPVCVGVAVVSYFDTAAKSGAPDRTTAPIGVVFAFAALFASAIYTVWIDKYHRVLECTSMQLLLNQAPVSVLIMLFVIPFSDDITVWAVIDFRTWMLVLLSGILACFINLSQFLIIKEAGPVSSTVVGHSKTCLIVATGWITSGRALSDGSLVGTVMAIGGIIAYTVVMQSAART